MDRKYLAPTGMLDSDHPEILAYAEEAVKGAKDPISRSVALYYAVRDPIWYDPYYPFHLPEHYRASNVLRNRRGYCVCKASLLCALGRACGIPSRLAFADVKNHLATRQLLAFLGTDLFVYHGMTEFFLDGKWVKCTPAFNKELCERHRVHPLEFDGREDSVFQPFNLDHQSFMEYVADHGSYSDVPLESILSAWNRAYGIKRVQGWIAAFEASGQGSMRDFSREDVV